MARPLIVYGMTEGHEVELHDAKEVCKQTVTGTFDSCHCRHPTASHRQLDRFMPSSISRPCAAVHDVGAMPATVPSTYNVAAKQSWPASGVQWGFLVPHGT